VDAIRRMRSGGRSSTSLYRISNIDRGSILVVVVGCALCPVVVALYLSRGINI
jgi:hypothetical protein